MLKRGARVALGIVCLTVGCAAPARAPAPGFEPPSAPGPAASIERAEPAASARPTPVPARPLRLHLVGDSTLAHKAPERFPETGWGEALERLLLPGLVLKNHARNGRSSKSFRDEGSWQALLAELEPGEFVLIQFGHNDEKQQDPTRYAAPRSDYRANLERFVSEVRAKGAEPLLITPVCRRAFDKNGKLVDTHGQYPGVVRELSREAGVPLVDLEALSRALLTKSGPTASEAMFLHVPRGRYAAYPEGKQDDTHFSEGGALLIAELFVRAMAEQHHPLAAHLVSNPLLASATPEALPLWDAVAPVQALKQGVERYEGERWYDVRTPALLPRLVAGASRAPRPAFLVFPGGGYRKLAWVKEGTRVADWLNSLGLQAFVVKYRLDSFGAPAPLLDARRALALVRERAPEFGVDPARIGVIGFSAGGHLAASLSTHPDDRVPDAAAATDAAAAAAQPPKLVAPPGLAILVYPVIELGGSDAHQDSLHALLGDVPTSRALDFYSVTKHVGRSTPATLLIHGAFDRSVPIGNSQSYERALSRAGVPSTLITYDSNEHGFGLDLEAGQRAWPNQAAEWLRQQGWLP